MIHISWHGVADMDYNSIVTDKNKHTVIDDIHNEVARQFMKHLWCQAKFIIVNYGALNSNGIFDVNDLIELNLFEWWTTYNDDYSFGIFTQRCKMKQHGNMAGSVHIMFNTSD